MIVILLEHRNNTIVTRACLYIFYIVIEIIMAKNILTIFSHFGIYYYAYEL